MNSRFLNKINEVAETTASDTTATGTTATGTTASGSDIKKPAKPVKDAATRFQPGKKTSLTQKLASGVSKAAQLAKNIETIGTGKWDVASFAQSILTKELDKGTAKLHTFGKKNYDTAVLGDQILRSLNMYGSAVTDKKTESGQAEIPDGKGGAGATTTESFLDKINVLLEKRSREELEKEAQKRGIPIVTKSGKKVRLDQLENKIEKSKAAGPTDETKERRKKAQEKQKTHTPKEASKAQEKAKFKPVGDKISAKERLLPIVSKLLGKENAEYNTTYITKNFNKILLTIQKMYGPESEYAKEKDAKPLDFTFKLPGAGRVADKEKKEEIKESAITLFLKEAVSDDIVKSLGRDGSLELLKGFEQTYPGKQITFKQEEKPEETKPESDVEMKEIPSETTFLISNPKNFGTRGVQYTLKPEDSKIASLLNKKGISFITYLVSKPNELGVRDDNAGTLYIYNLENQPISKLEKKAPFVWSSTLKAYKIAVDGEDMLGPQADKGEALVSSPEDPKAKFPLIAGYDKYKKQYGSSPVVFLQRPGGTELSKHKIIRFLPKTNNYVYDFKNPLPVSPADIKMLQADKLLDPDVQERAAVGQAAARERKAIERQKAAGELPLGGAAGVPKTPKTPKTAKPKGSKNTPKPKTPKQTSLPLESKFLEKIEEYM